MFSVKKLPMLLLVTVPYATLIICYQASLDILPGVWAYGALILFNILYAFLLPKLGFHGRQLLFWNLVLKLCNIPLVALIRLFALVMVMVGGTRLPYEGWSVVWISLAVLFVIRLSSAAFGISGFRWFRKYRTMSKAGMVAASVVQMIPGVDVISSVLCYIMFRKDVPFAE